MDHKRKQLVSSEEAVPCEAQPRKPCSDCPWAKTALPGWLGGFTVDQWIRAAHGEERIDCHTLIGPQCAGAAIYRSNVGKNPRDRGLLLLPKDTETVFASPIEFTKYHKK